MFINPKRFGIVVISIALCFTNISCGGGGKSNTVQPTNEIYGMVTFDGAVDGAAVRVLALDGTLIASTQTNAKGYYSVYANDRPVDFTVVAEGGKYQSKTLVGSLVSEVRNQPLYGKYTPVNPATTLVSLQIQRNPELTIEIANSAVKHYLGIPQALDLGFDLTTRHFSGALFALSADQVGGFSKLMPILLSELNNGKTHYFRHATLQDEGEFQIAAFVAKGLANGVLSRVGGDAFGSVMSSLGFGSSGSAESKAAAAAAAAQAAKLAEISNAISALSTKLDNVQNVVLVAIDKSSYVTALGQGVHDLIVANTYIDHELQTLALDPSNTVRKENLGNYILTNLVQGGMESWDSSLYGISTRDNSLIVLWSKVVQQLRTDVYDAKAANSVQAQWDYFDGQQARSIAYIVDYMRSRPEYDLTRDIIPTINRWKENRKKQMTLLRGNARGVDQFFYSDGYDVIIEDTPLMYLPANMVIDRASMLMWTTKPVYVGSSPLSTEYDQVISSAKTGLEKSTALTGWTLPPSRESIPHIAGDAGYLDGLKRMGVISTSDDYSILIQEDIYTRSLKMQTISFSHANYNIDTDRMLAYLRCTGAVFDTRNIISWVQYMPLLMSPLHYKFRKFPDLVNKNGMFNEKLCTSITDDIVLGGISDVLVPASLVDIFMTYKVASDYWYK